MKAAEYILKNEGEDGLKEYKIDKYNRVFYYTDDEFTEKHNKGLISEDAFKNRYSLIEVNDKKYRILNQWGSGNWDFVKKLLTEKKFTLKRIE